MTAGTRLRVFSTCRRAQMAEPRGTHSSLLGSWSAVPSLVAPYPHQPPQGAKECAQVQGAGCRHQPSGSPWANPAPALQAQSFPPGVAGRTEDLSPAEATSPTWPQNRAERGAHWSQQAEGQACRPGELRGPRLCMGRVWVAGSVGVSGPPLLAWDGGERKGGALPSGTRGMRCDAWVLGARGGGARKEAPARPGLG